MRRLLIFYLRISIVLALLLGSARMIGQIRPLPDRLNMLHLTRCAAPCWLGLVPGSSTLAEVRPTIRAAYSESEYELKFSTWDLEGTSNSIDVHIRPHNSSRVTRISLGARVNDPVIRDITIFPDNSAQMPDPLAIRDVYFAFGAPLAFLEQPWIVDGPGLVYGDDDQGVLLNVFLAGQRPAYRVTWTTPVRVIRMYGPGHYRVPPGIVSPTERQETRWHGFTWY
jgi:hypothetical protein